MYLFDLMELQYFTFMCALYVLIDKSSMEKHTSFLPRCHRFVFFLVANLPPSFADFLLYKRYLSFLAHSIHHFLHQWNTFALIYVDHLVTEAWSRLYGFLSFHFASLHDLICYDLSNEWGHLGEWVLFLDVRWKCLWYGDITF